MSFLKQLLTPFVEFDEDKPKAAPVQQQQAPVAVPTAAAPSKPVAPQPVENAQHPLINTASPTANTAAQVPTFSQSGTLTGPLPEHEQYFEKLINDANAKNPLFTGTDYKEFVDSKVDIDDILDETVRYRTAFAVLKSTGLTKEKLLSTGQEYLNLIGRDLNAFQSAHAQQYAKEVSGKEALIQKKAEELQALTQRINAIKGEINSLTQTINLTKDKLNTTKNSFLLAGEKKQTQIQEELSKIAQYF